jgi:hypothetical protein
MFTLCVACAGDADVCNCNTKDYVNRKDICYPELAPDEKSCESHEYGGHGCCDTYPDSTNNHLSLVCESMLQGSNRLQRGVLYMEYLQQHWANEGFIPNYSIVAGMTHNLTAFLISRQYQVFVFDV